MESVGVLPGPEDILSSNILDTLRLTFTANGEPLVNFSFYNSIIMVFTKVLKYIKQLLNLWYLAII